jgi:hypothetical protein
MTKTIDHIRHYRRVFGWVFILSGFLFSLARDISAILAITSLLTSLTSLLAFFFTTLLIWRKEKREQQQAELDLEKKRLEFEKMYLEIVQNQKKEIG